MSQLPRIGIYLDTWDFGGIATFCENLANGLAARGHEVTIVLGRDFKQSDDSARAAFDEMNATRSFGLEILHVKNWARRQRMIRVVEAIRALKFDVLFINNFDALLACFNTLAASTRLISIGHGDHSHCYAQFLATQYFVHRHIAISREILSRCRELCPPSYRDNVVLVPHGVASPAVNLNRPTREGDAGPLRVCYCGRFDFTDKRLQDLPTVWRAYQRRGGTGRLTLIGEGDVRRWLEEQFAKEIEYGEVIFTGRLSGTALSEAFANQEIFLSLSNWEGLGLAAIEAALHGAYPVLSAVRSGHRDIVDTLGFGTLCPVGDTEAFAEALRLAENQRAQLATSRTARAHLAAQQFGIERMVTDYSALAEAVVLEPFRTPALHLGEVRGTLSLLERWKGNLFFKLSRRFRKLP